MGIKRQTPLISSKNHGFSPRHFSLLLNPQLLYTFA